MPYDASRGPLSVLDLPGQERVELFDGMSVVERRKFIVEFLRALPSEQFTMASWHEDHSCGTVACVAGWCGELVDLRHVPLHDDIDIEKVGAAFLGLNTEEGRGLFCNAGQHKFRFWDSDDHWLWARPSMAADVIERALL